MTVEVCWFGNLGWREIRSDGPLVGESIARVCAARVFPVLAGCVPDFILFLEHGQNSGNGGHSVRPDEPRGRLP
jgi:hypothetical protein